MIHSRHPMKVNLSGKKIFRTANIFNHTIPAIFWAANGSMPLRMPSHDLFDPTMHRQCCETLCDIPMVLWTKKICKDNFRSMPEEVVNKKNINNMTEVYDPNCLEDVRNCGAQGEFKLVHVQPICVKGGVPHTLSIDQGLTSASAGKCLTRSFRGCNISSYFNL